MVLGASFTSESAISEFGFHAIPKEWSLDAYRYIITSKETILRAYGVTIFCYDCRNSYEYIGGLHYMHIRFPERILNTENCLHL